MQRRGMTGNMAGNPMDKGFNRQPGAVMTGVETRSSAPCRILRNRESFVSLGADGLYPIGEGAGYAGGIMSAAVDGRNAALAFLLKSRHTNRNEEIQP